MKKINAIIFDLGGVILNIDYSYTINAFKKLGVKDAEKFYSKKTQDAIFNKLETGKISNSLFLDNISKKTNINSAEKIKAAWCAMILDLPQKKIDFLTKLKKLYPLFLLSNTNAIHIDYFCKSIGIKQSDYFFSLFKKTYLSHEIGLRKPNQEAFQIILNENHLTPEEVLFLDDSPQHIKSARKLGINCYHVTESCDITTLFPDKFQSILH